MPQNLRFKKPNKLAVRSYRGVVWYWGIGDVKIPIGCTTQEIGRSEIHSYFLPRAVLSQVTDFWEEVLSRVGTLQETLSEYKFEELGSINIPNIVPLVGDYDVNSTKTASGVAYTLTHVALQYLLEQE